MSESSQRGIDVLFARLLVRYGADWMRKWEGMDMKVVKADWVSQLSGISKAALEHAVDHLPTDRPPNVAQFRALCLSLPAPVYKALPAPAPDSTRLAAAVAEARAKLTSRPANASLLALLEKQRDGKPLTPGQRAYLAAFSQSTTTRRKTAA